MKERYYSIDIYKLIAALLIICMFFGINCFIKHFFL